MSTGWTQEELKHQKQVSDLRGLLREAADMIQWMSGSNDFAPGGQAYEGWRKSQDKLTEIITESKR